MQVFVKGILILICLVIFIVWSTLKNENTLVNQMIIYHAISLYEYDCYKYNLIPKISIKDVKPYLSAFFALNDWGHKNLLSKEKYRLILPYIPHSKQWVKEVRGNHVRIL